MSLTLVISIKAQTGTIYSEQGETESVALIPALYDSLATKLSEAMAADGTHAEVEQVLEGARWVPHRTEPKITLVTTTFYDSAGEFAAALNGPQSVPLV